MALLVVGVDSRPAADDQQQHAGSATAVCSERRRHACTRVGRALFFGGRRRSKAHKCAHCSQPAAEAARSASACPSSPRPRSRRFASRRRCGRRKQQRSQRSAPRWRGRDRPKIAVGAAASRFPRARSPPSIPIAGAGIGAFDSASHVRRRATAFRGTASKCAPRQPSPPSRRPAPAARRRARAGVGSHAQPRGPRRAAGAPRGGRERRAGPCARNATSPLVTTYGTATSAPASSRSSSAQPERPREATRGRLAALLAHAGVDLPFVKNRLVYTSLTQFLSEEFVGDAARRSTRPVLRLAGGGGGGGGGGAGRAPRPAGPVA